VDESNCVDSDNDYVITSNINNNENIFVANDF